MTRLTAVAMMTALACSPGCDPGGDPKVERTAQSAAGQRVLGTWAHLQIRGSHRWTPSREESASHMELWAVFVDHQGIDAMAAAGQLGVPLSPDALSEGQCQMEGAASGARRRLPDLDDDEASIELLDAGALYFMRPGQSVLVRPSLYPDVLPHVSGLQYRTVVPAPADGLSTQRVSVMGLGGREISTFELMQQRGPREFRILTVLGSHPSEGPFTASLGEPLRVRWAPGQAGYQRRVRFVWPRQGRRAAGALVCRPRRLGELTVPWKWLRRLPVGRQGLEGRLEVRITRILPAQVPGVERTTLRIIQSDEVPLTLVR